MLYGMHLPIAFADDEEMIRAVWRAEVEREGCEPVGDPTWTIEQPIVDTLTDEDGTAWPLYPIVRVIGTVQ